MSKKNRRRYHRPATIAITEDQTLKTENENAEQRFDALKNFYTILTIGRALASNDGYANSAAYLGELGTVPFSHKQYTNNLYQHPGSDFFAE